MTRSEDGELEANNTPIAMRKQALAEDFLPYVKGIFAKQPELKSALFAVAQYWADEADDAVHDRVVFSKRATPFWPHMCQWETEQQEENEAGGAATDMASTIDDVCASCGSDLGWMPFDDNGSSITAFRSCCREDASQESSTARAYLPYAVARRTSTASDDIAIEIEIVGGPIRAWLDDGRRFDADGDEIEEEEDNDDSDDDDDESQAPAAAPMPPVVVVTPRDARTQELFDLVYQSPADDGPRQVLADWLQQKDDPLGQYITLSLTRLRNDAAEINSRKKALEQRHAREWLGELLYIVPEEHASFGRGFVQSIAVHIDADREKDTDQKALASLAWGTVESLRFLPTSKQVFSPTMTGLRSVGALTTAGLTELANHPAVARTIEHIALELEEDSLARLLALSLPKLTRLSITSRGNFESRSMNGGTGNDDEEGYYDDDDARAYRALINPQAVKALLASPLWKQLEELIVGTMGTSSVAGWFALPRSQRPRTITFSTVSVTGATAGFRIRVTDDTLAIVDMPSLHSESSFARVGRVLAILPKGARVEVAATPFFDPTDADLGALSKAADRPITRSR